MAMGKRFRQYLGILTAIIAYYIVHEGAHLVTALYYGAFRQIRFLGMGVQIDIYPERMTDTRLGIFCLTGAVATLVCGWLLIFLAKRICKIKSKTAKAIWWYITLAFLLLDPLYLSILCGFFGGGDMNGIRLLVPEIFARLVFGAIALIHGIVIRKYLLPEYTRAFRDGM